jgi:RNA polymerase sigma-70 factor (ECF subfamily)
MKHSGDQFEQVAMPHARSLLRFALRLTHNSFAAEDLVQESLMLAWRGFHQLEAGTNARAWLFRILINAYRGQLRKERSACPTVLLTSELPAASPSSGSEYLEVAQAIDRLAMDHRTVLLLAVVEGFTCREIAEILAIPLGTVMSRLSRARDAMREALAPGTGQRGERAVK